MGRGYSSLESATLMPQEWDEKGNPVAAQEWDEKGNPISSSDSLRTGAGMEAAAHEQARETPVTAAAKMKPNYSALMLSNSPSGADPHNAGNPNLNAVPEEEREGVNSRALNTALATTPLVGPAGRAAEAGVPGLLKLGRGVIGAGIGGGLG